MTRRTTLLLLTALAAFSSRLELSLLPRDHAIVQAAGSSLIERLDPALDALLAPNAQLLPLATGYKWTEGPVWLPTNQLCKDLNNIIEADHGALKRVIRPNRGFQTMRTAAATIKGFEVVRMIRREHCING